MLEGGTNPSISFNADRYVITHGSKTTIMAFPCELPTNCKRSVKTTKEGVYCGLGFTKGTGFGNIFLVGNDKMYEHHYANSSYGGSSGNVPCDYPNSRIDFVIEKTGQNVVVKVNDITYMTKTLSFSNSDTLYAGASLTNEPTMTIREIIIEPL